MPDSEINVSLFYEFLQELSVTTARTYTNTYRANYTYYLNIIKPRLGHLKMKEITTVHLQHYINTLIEEKRYSKGTINLTSSFIRTSLKRAKNNTSIRTIHIPQILVEELNSHRKLIKYEKEKAGDKYTDLDLVLPSKYGKPLDSRSIRRSFYNVTEKLGLKNR